MVWSILFTFSEKQYSDSNVRQNYNFQKLSVHNFGFFLTFYRTFIFISKAYLKKILGKFHFHEICFKQFLH